MKIAHGDIFFVYYLVLFVRSNYIELHHFIILTLWVAEVLILIFLQHLWVPNIALVNIRNDFRHLVILLGKFKL